MKKHLFLVSCLLALSFCGGGVKFQLTNSNIFEGSSAGTEVGTLSVTNPKDGVNYTYELVDDAEGRFGILNDKLIVSNGKKIDFENSESHTIKVKVTNDNENSGEEEFEITVDNVALEVTSLNNTGNGTLRKLVTDASAGAVIAFDANLEGTIELTSGYIAVNKKITILGPGSSIIKISGMDTQETIRVGGDGNLILSGVTLQDGGSAALINLGTTTISHSVVKNSSGGYGGGINSSGTLTIRNCIITGNEAFNGGGIGSGGDLKVYNSVIYNNQTTGNSGAGVAGSGEMTFVNTTISGNTVTGADRVGGGIGCFAEGDPSKLNLFNVTITNNSATGDGGGIYFANCDLKIKNTIIAGNTAGSDGPDLFLTGSSVNSRGYNLIGDGTDSGFTDGENNDQVGTGGNPIDPKLAELSLNDGVTRTHALQSNSPALDMIPAASCKDDESESLTQDQRGFLRPVNEKCDIGAFERQSD